MAGREDLRSMQDAWRAYLDLALGLTETSRKRATKVAKNLVGRGGATAEQLQTMAEDLLNTSLANREAMTRLIRFELDRALGRVGLATAEEVSELTERVRDLEEELRQARAAAVEPVPATVGVPLPVAAAGPVKAVRKVAKKAGAAKAGSIDAPLPATKGVAAMAGSVEVPPPTKKAAKKAPAKKVVVKKVATRKSTPGGAAGDLGQGRP